MPQSTQTTLEPETNPTSSDTDTQDTAREIIEWQCPCCEQTRQSPADVREHITMSTDDAHMGKSGWSISEDIVGYDATGKATRVIEGFTETVDPEDQTERGIKKKQIVNAWVARPLKADVDAVNAVTDASRQYVYKVLGDLNEDEYRDHEVAELVDPDMGEELGNKIDDFHDQQKNTTMSVETTEAGEKLDPKRGEGRDYLYNVMLMAPGIHHTVIPKVISISDEYARRVFKEVRNNEVSADTVEAAYNEKVQRELLDSLETIGALENVDANISDTLELPEAEEEPEPESESESAEEVEEEDDWPTIEERSKKLVINSWLLANEHGQELKPKPVSNASGCGYEYARRTLKELKEGDIPEHEIKEAEAEDLKNTLREIYVERGFLTEEDTSEEEPEPEAGVEEGVEVEEEVQETADAEYQEVATSGEMEVVTDFERGDNGTAVQCVAVTADDARCDVTAQDDSHFCHIHRPGEDAPAATTTETETDEVSEDDLPDVPGSKRDALLNLHSFDLDLNNSDAGDAVGASAEYARQTTNKIDDGDITEDDIQSAQDEEVQDVLQTRLELLGFVEAEDAEVEPDVAEDESEAPEEVTEEPESESESEPETTAEPEPEVEEEPESEPAVELEVTPTAVADAENPEEKLQQVAAELDHIRDKADSFLRMAQYEGDGQEKKAEFIAKELGDDLENLLEMAQ